MTPASQDSPMGTKQEKVRVRKTPNALHAYTATIKGHGTYGWGNSPAEARAKLAERLAPQVSA